MSEKRRSVKKWGSFWASGFSIDSRPIEKKLTPKEKEFYLREIKEDITYFRKSYQQANLQVDISGLDQDQAARKVKEAVEELDGKVMHQAKSEPTG